MNESMKHFLNVWLTLLFTFYMLGLTLYILLILTYGFIGGLGYQMTDTTYIEIYTPSIVTVVIGSLTCWFFTRKIDQPGWLKVIAVFSFPYSWFTFYPAGLFLGPIFSFNSFIVTFALFVIGLIKFVVERIIERKRSKEWKVQRSSQTIISF